MSEMRFSGIYEGVGEVLKVLDFNQVYERFRLTRIKRDVTISSGASSAH